MIVNISGIAAIRMLGEVVGAARQRVVVATLLSTQPSTAVILAWLGATLRAHLLRGRLRAMIAGFSAAST